MSDTQRDREERQHVIEVLEHMLEWMKAANTVLSKPERIKALDYAINSIKTDLKYDLLYEETSGQADKQADKPTTKNETLVSFGAYKQVAWERDIAIQQLHELGYEFGQKIEPTTKNDLALIHTGGLDEGIRCAMCTNSMKSDRGCDGSCVVDKDMYEKVIGVIDNHIAVTDKMTGSTTKDYLGVDYLGVDCISRADVLKLMQDNWHTHNGDWAMQESMDDIRALPAVTSIRPKGHWIEQIDHEENCRTLICSNCDRPALHDGDSIWKHKFCPHCGADMRGEEK